MSPTFNRSSALERFKRSYAIEIRNGIMFNFYPGLPHVLLSLYALILLLSIGLYAVTAAL